MFKGVYFQFYIFVQTIDDKYLYQDQMHAAGLLRIKGNRYYTIRTCPNPHVLLLCHHWKYFISTMSKHKSFPFFTQIISLRIVDLIHYKEDYSISNIHESIFVRIWYQNLDQDLTLYFEYATLRAIHDGIRNILSSKHRFILQCFSFILHSLSNFRINTSNYATDTFE